MSNCNRDRRSVRLESAISLYRGSIAIAGMILAGVVLASITAASPQPANGAAVSKKSPTMGQTKARAQKGGAEAAPNGIKSSAGARVDDGKTKAIVRLSRDVLPTNYDLTVEPDMKKFTFLGRKR